MALLGIQFVISLTVALFLQKLSPYFSLSRWIMCSGLYRYLHPTNDQLRALAGKTTVKSRGTKKNAQNGTMSRTNTNVTAETFSIPCNLDVQLEVAQIQEIDLYSQYKYKDVRWLIDFSLSALMVFLCIELAVLIKPDLQANEFNQSIIWNGLVITFAIKDLVSLAQAYWKSDDGGERAMFISFVFFYLVLSMGVLVVDESLLDFGLTDGYGVFCDNLKTTYAALGLTASDPPPLWVFKLLVAAISATLGALLGFPGLRLANIHMQSIKMHQHNPAMFAVLQTSFILPLATLLLWINPVSRDLLTDAATTAGHVYTTTSQKPLLSEAGFLHLRFSVVLAFVVLRLLLIRVVLQSYLNMASDRVESVKRETGRITNIELQRKVARINYYLSAATLQYVAPVVMVLFLALSTWTFERRIATPLPQETVNDNVNTAAEYVKLLRNVFHARLFSALSSYLTWWCLCASFVSSLFGLVYLKVTQ